MNERVVCIARMTDEEVAHFLSGTTAYIRPDDFSAERYPRRFQMVELRDGDAGFGDVVNAEGAKVDGLMFDGTTAMDLLKQWDSGGGFGPNRKVYASPETVEVPREELAKLKAETEAMRARIEDLEAGR